MDEETKQELKHILDVIVDANKRISTLELELEKWKKKRSR